MELNLERPLVFFDIESTGLNIASDAIIELCFVKIMPGGEKKVQTWRVKPWNYAENCQKEINPAAEAVHGISSEDLKECPRFYDICEEVAEWISGCDLAGFNSAKFDLPLLAEEFERARGGSESLPGKSVNVDLHDMKMVDVQNIFHMMEPRTLKAAYKFYCSKELENAHAAEADTMATYEVLVGQLEKYADDPRIENNVDKLAKFSTKQKAVDFAGRLVLNDKNEPTVSFGKHKDKTLREVYETEPAYFSWIEKGDFTLDTKQQFAKLKQQYDHERRAAAKTAAKPVVKTADCPRTKGNTPLEGLGELMSFKKD